MTDKLSYTVFAEFYDDIMITVPYDDWLEYLELIFQEIDFHPQKILDLACGTGNMALLLAKQGYELIGIDGSVDMIRVAQRKALEAGILANFYQAYFQEFTVREPVDLVISLYDSLNYLLTEEDLAKTFDQIFHALKPQGYLIFDLNTIKRLSNIEEGRNMFEGEGYYCFWRDVVELDTPYWKVYLTFFLEQEDGSLIREDEIHTERGYELTKVQSLLKSTGFELVKLYDAFTLLPGDEDSERIYIVARKLER